jgi:signal transduction histidine kinase/DNA-binding response OmpR family regulator
VNRQSAEAAEATTGRSAPSSREATILLVDDHPPNLMVLRSILEPLGRRLVCASSGTQAVEIAQREELALILLDLQMPELDGLETAALLKKKEKCRSVPIIIVTASEPSHAEIARGYATGAVDFLYRPFDANLLRSKVSVFVQLFEEPSSHGRGASSQRPEDSGRLSERLIAAAPTSAQVAMVEELAAVAQNNAAAASENARLYEEARDARHRAELSELELRASEARLRIALEAAGLGTWEYNPITGAMRWDARCKALAGLAADVEVDYPTFLRCVHPIDRERVDGAVRRTLHPDTDPNFEFEYRALGVVDGGERWISARGLRIGDHARSFRIIGAMLDVTSKKRVEQERLSLLASERQARAAAESASRAKDEFLATVSHELRNPLNAILGWSRVLVEEREIDPDRMKKGLAVILRNAKAQIQLVEDILEVSRIITGKLRLATGRVDIGTLVESAVETVRAAAQAKRVSLESHRAALGTIVADEDRVQQILWNLLSNAVKFTPPGGRVTVSASRGRDAVALVVADTGEGIAPEFLPYVFDRFRQFDGSTTRTHGGLGLGLAIVRHLAELHGGTVHAESAGLKQGATFTVVLPVTSEACEAPPPTLPPQPRRENVTVAGRLQGRRVLVLDDDADMRGLIAMILENAGADVVAAESVKSALAAIHASPPDVAISDLAMPVEDGYAFARRLRASPEDAVRRIPLVAMTAYARAEDRRRVLDAGFDQHVAKPIEPDELVDALAAVLAGGEEPR